MKVVLSYFASRKTVLSQITHRRAKALVMLDQVIFIDNTNQFATSCRNFLSSEEKVTICSDLICAGDLNRLTINHKKKCFRKEDQDYDQKKVKITLLEHPMLFCEQCFLSFTRCV